MRQKVALVAVLLTASVMAIAQDKERHNTVSVCIAHVETSPGERIVGFRIEVTSGMVESVSNLPMGWYVDVDNDPSWRPIISGNISGNISVGAAALDQHEFRKLRIIVQRTTPQTRFAMSGTVAVTTDFKTTRNIPLAATDFQLSTP